ncbi:murein transglycosylase [Stagonosporopsis vannaccii]|nr:murein transglycosylase [Stagonosporopsis vannaccii]
MFRPSTTWLAMLLAASSTLTFAQTTTSCDPTKKTCPDDPALSSSTYTHDFTSSGFDSDAWNITAGNVSATSSGLEFTITKSGDAPTIRSNWYIFFGRVSFLLRAAPGTGIVSSAILQSDDLDEVDWEWLGGSGWGSKVQSNYFGKGNVSSYDRAVWTDVTDTQTTTHNYTISWTKDAIIWYIDGAAIRSLAYQDALSGKNFPQTPMDVRIGIWAGGDPANDEGTIEWAGGETDYSAGPYTMVLERVEVVNENPGQSYTYGDMTGDYTSIKVNDADGEGEDRSSSSASSTSKTSAQASGASKTSTMNATASSTQTGMSWTASVSASATAERAQASSDGASPVSFEYWQRRILGVILLVVACW